MQLATVSWLLEREADCNQTNSLHDTPMQIATRSKHRNTIELLTRYALPPNHGAVPRPVPKPPSGCGIEGRRGSRSRSRSHKSSSPLP